MTCRYAKAGRAIAGAALVVLLVAGCGSDDDGNGAASESPASESTVDETSLAAEAAPVLPVDVTNADGTTVTVTDVSRIIPLNGDVAEVVYALGLGDQVVATDVSATYPAEAAALPKIGYQRELSAEGILSFGPTVLIGSSGAGPPDVISQLAVAVPTVILEFPTDLSQPTVKIEAIAEALGVPNRGRLLADEVQAEIDEATTTAATSDAAPRAMVLYLRGANVQMIFGPGTGADALIEAAGAVDAAAESGVQGTVPITPEALVAAAPDVLIVTTSGLASVGGIDGLLAIPGVAQTPAGENRRVVDFDDQYLLGGGPRTGQALQELVDALHPQGADG